MTDRLTRQQFLRRAVAGGATLTLPSILAACGGGGGIKSAARTNEAATPVKEQLAKTLNFSNWPLYIDINEKTKKRPTLQGFEKKYDVNVKYTEDINDNDSFFGKIEGPLSKGQPVGRDIIVMTDSSGLPARMVKLGWLEQLHEPAIPNKKNLVESLASPSWDPERKYSLPWQSGMTGIGYDPDKVGGELTDFNRLLDDPKLKGKVTLLTEMSDTVGLVMLANGDDPTKVTEAAFQKALDRIQKAVDSGQVRQFTGNDYASLLSKGDVWACVAWSGDMVQLQADKPGLKWNLPESGGMIWTDNMLIPKGGDIFTASTLMNYYYDPKVAAKVEAYVNYICPVVGADKELQKTDPDIAKNPLIFPTEEMRANAKQIDPNAVTNQDFKQRFQALLGA